MARKKEDGRSAVQRKRKLHLRRPATARHYFSMSPRDRETWDSVGQAVSRMRDGLSLRKASREFGIGSRTVVMLGRSALRERNGRYVPTKTDRLLRVLSILSPEGKRTIAIRDSRQASVVGRHWAAVQGYLQTGDDSALSKFKNKKIIDAKHKRHLLLTDLAELERQASAGVLSFESIYASGAR